MPVRRSDGSPAARRRKAEQKRDKKKRAEEEQDAAPEAPHLKEAAARPAALPMKLTKYERVQVLGSRACDLAAGADPLLPVLGALDPLVVAMEEMERGLLNSKVVRTFPSGEQTVHLLQTLL